jgi:membrane fusion protein
LVAMQPAEWHSDEPSEPESGGVLSSKGSTPEMEPVNPVSSRFREQVVRAYFEPEHAGHLLSATPPGAWAVLLVLGSIAVCAFIAAFVCQVELTSRGRGVLRSASGSSPVTALVAGTIMEVSVRSGNRVRQGERMASIDSATIKASLLEADQTLALVNSNLKKLQERQKVLFDRRLGLYDQRSSMLERRINSQSESVARLRSRVSTYEKLGEEGVVGKFDEENVREQMEEAARRALSLEEELSQTRLEAAALEAERDTELWKLLREVREAQSRRDALAFSLEQTKISAPRDGIMEAVLVRPGEAIQIGQPIGRLVPEGAPTLVVSFLPERDRAFVHVGTEARIELEQLPVGEFGALHATVYLISQDLASTAEVREALGETSELTEPSYRVELTLLEDAQAKRLSPHLRVGNLSNVRYPLRKRRAITLVLDPLRRFFKE